MNQEKIGKFILKLRMDNNLSQAKFADKIGVTYQAVSKWENGRGIPDIEMLKKISEVFDVDIDEIINGEKKKQKSKYNLSLLIASVFGIVVIVLFLLITIFFNKDNINVANINSIESNFSVNGVIVSENNSTMIHISDIRVNKELDKKFYSIESMLYEDNNKNYKIISEYKSIANNNETKNLDELLKEVKFDIENYSDSCPNISTHNFYIVINALDEKKNKINYKIPLSLENKCS